MAEDTSLTGIKNKIEFMLDRYNMSSNIIDVINTVIRRIERKHNLNYMIVRDDTGVTLTTGTYELTIPARFKEMIELSWNNNGNRDPIHHYSEEMAMREYGDLTNDTGEPVYYSKKTDGKFLIRPTANADFTVYKRYYAFSAPVEIGAAETHWLFDNFQEVILYGACMEFMPILQGEALALSPIWAAALKDALKSLKAQEDHEASAGTQHIVRGSYASR